MIDLHDLLITDVDKVDKINHNLKVLDCWIMPVFEDLVGQVTPPTTPVESRIFIVAASATDEWLGQDAKWAYYIDDTWYFTDPLDGIQVFNDADGAVHYYNGTGFVRF